MLPEPQGCEGVVELKKHVPEGVRADREVHESVLRYGIGYLSDRQLLGLLTRSPDPNVSSAQVAQRLLDEGDGTLLGLGRLPLQSFMNQRGIGEARAIQVVAAIELGRRRLQAEPKEGHMISSSVTAYDLLRGSLMDLTYEEFWLLLLDRGNRVRRKERISQGGLHGTVADPKVIYETALRYRASSIVLAHNHPSGQLRPSEEDIRLTRKLVEAGRFLDITVHDHLIITQTGYFSFADNGMLH